MVFARSRGRRDGFAGFLPERADEIIERSRRTLAALTGFLERALQPFELGQRRLFVERGMDLFFSGHLLVSSAPPASRVKQNAWGPARP